MEYNQKMFGKIKKFFLNIVHYSLDEKEITFKKKIYLFAEILIVAACFLVMLSDYLHADGRLVKLAGPILLCYGVSIVLTFISDDTRIPSIVICLTFVIGCSSTFYFRSNEGTGTLWFLLMPCLMMYFMGFLLGFSGSLAILISLLCMSNLPFLKEDLFTRYTEGYVNRYIVLYFLDFLLSTIAMYNYYSQKFEQKEEINRLNEKIKNEHEALVKTTQYLKSAQDSKDPVIPILNSILTQIQLIEVSTKIFHTNTSDENLNSAALTIEQSIRQIKQSIGKDVYSEAMLYKESEIPFDLRTIMPDEEITEDFSIAIFGKQTEDNVKLKIILQSYGFFSRIISEPEEIIFSLEDGLIQFLIIQPTSENDETFVLCEKIREKHTLLDFPILALVNQFRTYLIQKCFDSQINDFIVRPFDVSELITRIQSLANYRKLYIENQELLVSEKEKRAFLYFVTHNVNTPLTVLLNEIHELLNYSQENPEIEQIIVNIQESTNQINIIIQNVLNSYKISDGRYLINSKIINLYDYLSLENRFLYSKAEFKKQSFNFICENRQLRTFCDENSLKGIYTNLVDNAIKYSPIGGKIKVILTANDENIFLKVCDNGQGIPKEKQSILFNRFANIGSRPTGSEKSVGLGLYVVNEICKLNHLTMEYSENTEEASGSIFTIKFPKLN